MENLKNRGFYIQFDQPEKVKGVKDSINVRGYFTQPVSVPDLHPPSVALYFVGFQRGAISAIGIGVKTGTPSTSTSRIKIKRLVSLSGDPQISEFLDESDSSKILAAHFVESNDVNIENGVANAILREICKKYNQLERKIDEIIRIATE